MQEECNEIIRCPVSAQCIKRETQPFPLPTSLVFEPKMERKTLTVLFFVSCAFAPPISSSAIQYFGHLDKVMVSQMDGDSCCNLQWIDGSDKKLMQTALRKVEWGIDSRIESWYVRVGSQLAFLSVDSPLNSTVKVLANPSGCDCKWLEENVARKSDNLVLPVYQNVIFANAYFQSSKNYHMRLALQRIEGDIFYSSFLLKKEIDSNGELQRLYINCTNQLSNFGLRFHSISYDKVDTHAIVRERKEEQFENQRDFSTDYTFSSSKDVRSSFNLTLISHGLPFKFVSNKLPKQEDSFLGPIFKSGDFLSRLPFLNSNGHLSFTGKLIKLRWENRQIIGGGFTCNFTVKYQLFTIKSLAKVVFEVFPVKNDGLNVNQKWLKTVIEHHGFEVSTKNDTILAQTDAYLDVLSYKALDPSFDCYLPDIH